jgi:hypothetical protein
LEFSSSLFGVQVSYFGSLLKVSIVRLPAVNLCYLDAL